ncbi:MAG: ExbD/TolR family protein [Sandaracinaceae bacterium]|nr:ExbD/TolR family protein [Sandaracinaceae bacterium]
MGMSTGGGGGQGRAPLSEINVTPLVDVMLVLLIIFMVTAPLLSAGVEVDLPNADAPNMPIEEEKMLLIIDAEQRVYLRVIGGETEHERVEVPTDRLAEALSSNALIRESSEIFVQADEAVPYGFVAQVLAIIRQAGVEHLGLVTDPRGEAAAATPTPAP